MEIGLANHKDHREDGTNDTQKIATDGVTVVKFGKVENLENTGTPNSAMDEGNLGKLLIKGLAMQDCTTVASVKKKGETDSVLRRHHWKGVGLECSSPSSRTRIRILAKMESVRACRCTEQQAKDTKVHSVDTKWIDTHKAFEEEPMQIRSCRGV